MLTNRMFDERALQAMLAAERPRLVLLCASLLGEREAAEDIAQETLLVGWRQLDRLRDPQAFGPWLSGIARNLCARWLRARGREHKQLMALPQELDALPELAGQADFEAELDRQDLAALLDQALELLPPTTRDVLVRKYLAESSHAAIAEELGLSENAVAVRLHRGRLALRALLQTELRAEAETLGLLESPEPWQETRIWCSACGSRRMQGSFTAAEFRLRCPSCCTEPDAYHSQSYTASILEGVKGFRPAMTRFSVWMDNFFQRAITERSVPCRRCGRTLPLRLHLPNHAPASFQHMRGLHVLCECGNGSYESLDGMALNTPAGRRFWQANQRIQTLPQQEIEVAGTPAILIRFVSIPARAALEVTVRQDTYAVLTVQERADG